jgi:hypothetical protein
MWAASRPRYVSASTAHSQVLPETGGPSGGAYAGTPPWERDLPCAAAHGADPVRNSRMSMTPSKTGWTTFHTDPRQQPRKGSTMSSSRISTWIILTEIPYKNHLLRCLVGSFPLRFMGGKPPDSQQVRRLLDRLSTATARSGAGTLFRWPICRCPYLARRITRRARIWSQSCFLPNRKPLNRTNGPSIDVECDAQDILTKG